MRTSATSLVALSSTSITSSRRRTDRSVGGWIDENDPTVAARSSSASDTVSSRYTAVVLSSATASSTSTTVPTAEPAASAVSSDFSSYAPLRPRRQPRMLDTSRGQRRRNRDPTQQSHNADEPRTLPIVS